MWVISLLLLLLIPSSGYAAIPGAASSDPLYNQGYLVCDYYFSAGQAGDNSTDSVTQLNTCMLDAYNNQLTAYLNTCGTYLISNMIEAYEWVGWTGGTSGHATAEPANNHVFRGRHDCGVRPKIKIKTGSSAFTSTSTPRPMVNFRNFEPINNNAVSGTKPSTPLGDVTNFLATGRGSKIFFTEMFEGIDLDTNAHAGAIGLVMQAAQQCFILNSTITATGSIAGIYAPPGRNSLTGNVEIIGGDYGIIQGIFGALNLPFTSDQGPTLVGIKFTNQAVRAIRVDEAVPMVLVGFEITKTSDGPAIETTGSGFVLKDGKITMSSAAANDVVIDNNSAGGSGLNLYVAEVYVNGSTQLISNGGSVVTSPGGTWPRIVEFAYNDQFNYQNGSTDPTVFPSYPIGQSRFEARSVLAVSGANAALGGGSTAISQVVSNSSTPPSDLLTRHLWTQPNVEDGACVDPQVNNGAGAGVAYVNVNLSQAVTNSVDSTAALQEAINDANAAGHDRVCGWHGSLLISGTINFFANTRIIGAGPHKTVLSYKSTWGPTSAVPFIQTVDSATAAPYLGYLSLYIRTQPQANDYMYYAKIQSGRTTVVGVDLNSQFMCGYNGGTCTLVNNPRYAVWFTNHGGGKFYGMHQYIPTDIDRNSASRLIFLDGNSMPASFYAQNLEAGKSGGGHLLANVEVKNNSAGTRIYGVKREGMGGSVLVTDSSNVGFYGSGAMSTGGVAPDAEAYVKVTGASDGILAAAIVVRGNDQASLGTLMLKETVTGRSTISTPPWPNALSVYKRGTLDETPFAAVPPAAPVLLSVTVNAVDRIDVRWRIFDGAALTPSSGATGFTVTVNSVPKTGAIQSVVLQGLDTYYLTLTGGTITTGTDLVDVAYTPGNIQAGGAGTPLATAFTTVRATNTLAPVPTPVSAQTAYFFRSLSGGMDLTSSPPYSDGSNVYENVPGRFIQGAMFRVHIKVSNNVADAAARALYLCYQENGTGAYAPLPDSCASSNTCFGNAPDLADGAPTPELLTPTEATFVPGCLLKTANSQCIVTLPQNSETGIEASVQIKDTASIANTYSYRICESGGAALNTYTQTPVVTVVSRRGTFEGGGSMN